MELIVDFHTHSHYSRATSKECTLAGLYKWGKLKGISVIGTGDFTHPAWFDELRDELVPSDDGLWQLRPELAKAIDETLPISVRDNPIRFVPTVEIATIYSKGGKVRKLHQLIVAPDFQSVSKLNSQLDQIGNLKADGRPILGLDSKTLLQMVLETDERMLYIPAHIWTPWFGMFGSKSGFDSISETYEDLAPEIKAIETGLSADPGMCWQVKELQNVAITSNSDAHSPQKLGREATVVQTDLSYDSILGAFKTNDNRLVGTIEFFPQEGKYHYDGHRTCNVCFSPEETKAHNGICPVCGKPLTVGVDYRVEELTNDQNPKQQKHVEYIIPLIEILAELAGKGPSSKAVVAEYEKVIEKLGDEFSILRALPIESIKAQQLPELAYAIDRLRKKEIHIEPGYDGVYGVIKLFADKTDRASKLGQLSLDIG